MNGKSGRCKWCGALAIWHGVRGAEHADVWACEDHHGEMLREHVDWWHPWMPDCAGGRFSVWENRCLPTSPATGRQP